MLPIEFYEDGKNRFGGDISKEQYERLSVSVLAERFGYTVEYISRFDFEIHSWSGECDRARTPVFTLPA